MLAWLHPQSSEEKERKETQSDLGEWTTAGKEAHHLVATTHKDGDDASVGASLNDEHLVSGGTKGDLSDDTR